MLGGGSLGNFTMGVKTIFWVIFICSGSAGQHLLRIVVVVVLVLVGTKLKTLVSWFW